MAKSSAGDEELRRACEVAIKGTKQKIVMSIRVAKSGGIWGKSGRLVKSKGQETEAFLLVLNYSSGEVLEENTPSVTTQRNQQDGPIATTVTESDLKVSVKKKLVSQAEEEDMEALLGTSIF